MYAKNAWDKYENNQYQEVMDFNEGYKSLNFLHFYLSVS